MPIIKQLKGKVPVKIYTDQIEPEAIEQLKKLAQLDIIHSHIAAMPDVHMGIGATVGSVIPTLEAIIPAAVGVDIGCGMNAVKLSLKAHQLPDNLKPIRLAIEQAVPVGFDKHDSIDAPLGACRGLSAGLTTILETHPDIAKKMSHDKQRWIQQMGTLGSGNHFIEICLDQNDDVWVMLHSGSRGIGNAIGTYFIELAKKDMQTHLQNLPHKDLAYFTQGTKYFDDYVYAVHWAQDYAQQNRQEMMRLVLTAMANYLPPFSTLKEAVNCHHNYVSVEEHFGKSVFLTRKGAISARKGQWGIIPGSMGACSYIVQGKGCAQSFHSCAHGAGRRMSRRQAIRQFSRQDLKAQTHGVECRKDKHVIDEIPAAYKDIDTVMRYQSDLVDILFTLKQVVCVKG